MAGTGHPEGPGMRWARWGGGAGNEVHESWSHRPWSLPDPATEDAGGYGTATVASILVGA